MKTRPATILGCLLLLSGPLPAQPTVPAPPPTSSGVVAGPTPWANKLFLPNIEADASQPAPDEVVQDFGTLPKGTLAVHRFILTNIYAVPMQVTDIRRTSETVKAYPPERVLQPYEKAEFIVTMDTAKFTGAGSETVQVSFGPTSISTATLRLKATSRADVMLSAPGSFSFGVVTPGSSPTKSLTLEYTGKQKDWAVTGVVPPTGPFEVTTSDGGKGKTKVNVTIKSKVGNTTGSINDFLQLRTNDPTTPVVTIAVNGMLQASLDVSPAAVGFGNLRVGETAKFHVLVRSGVPFKVEALADAGDGLSVETLPAQNRLHTLHVYFTPTKAGAFTKVLKLPTDMKSQATVDLTITANVLP